MVMLVLVKEEAEGTEEASDFTEKVHEYKIDYKYYNKFTNFLK